MFIYILFLSTIVDFIIGDPWGWLHPVQVMGWVINAVSNWIIKTFPQPHLRKIGGIFLCLGMIWGSAIAAWIIIYISLLIHPLLSGILQIIMLASCFAGKSLRNAAEDVINTIDADNLTNSQQRLAMYVGRDTDKLSIEEILRAVLETVTENATDGVTAPLFYAIAGGLIHPLLMIPLAWGYKAASTLDSMVGYKKEPYKDLGWCSAKLEDILTWLPCRLTVLSISLISGKPLQVWQLCLRDAILDPSPNSGWSECAYAAALGVQVGGINYYQGELREKPLLGDYLQPITRETITKALNLTRYTCLLWLTITGFMAISLHFALWPMEIS